MKYFTLACIVLALAPAAIAAEEVATTKPAAPEILQTLRDGNARFAGGKAEGPHRNPERIALAATSDQGNFAVATVLSCSDSRVPVELLFDTGIMDLFVVRVAGNVADVDEVGTIEYGLAHVRTPVLVVLGHSGCGAVKAVNQAAHGEGHALEKNIPPLVDNIGPAVERAMAAHPDATGDSIVSFEVEENVWQAVHDVYLHSAAVRQMVAESKVQVVGAIYDLATGKVRWLDEQKSRDILAQVNEDPARETEAMAGNHSAHKAPATH
jgi:carbonic anhydrase